MSNCKPMIESEPPRSFCWAHTRKAHPLMSRTHLLATGRAFLFDMDGTILDSNAIVEKLWRIFAKRHNLDADDILSFSHGRPSITTIAHFLPDLSADEHQHLSDERTAEEIRITSGIVAIPGAVAFFQQLDQLGVPYAVVTSATADLARTRIVAAGLPIPDVLVTPETITQGKPNPEGYLTAASQLGVAPSQTVVFEDADAGITAGIASGAQVVVVGSATRHDDRIQAHPHIPDFRGVTVDALGDGTFTVATP